MGNRFGNYQTAQQAEEWLTEREFTKQPSGNWTKPSLDGFGYPTTAVVEITTGRVAGEYTESGKDEIYYQHHFIN